MKNDLLKLVRWFCRRLTFNDLASVVPVLQEVLTGSRQIELKPAEDRPFKQLVERLNRTYKFHTRPRAGFKSFDGIVALTTLFVAFYNFMRPHGYLKQQPPVPLRCLQDETLYPKMWVELLRQAA